MLPERRLDLARASCAADVKAPRFTIDGLASSLYNPADDHPSPLYHHQPSLDEPATRLKRRRQFRHCARRATRRCPLASWLVCAACVSLHDWTTAAPTLLRLLVRGRLPAVADSCNAVGAAAVGWLRKLAQVLPVRMSPVSWACTPTDGRRCWRSIRDKGSRLRQRHLSRCRCLSAALPAYRLRASASPDRDWPFLST